MAIDVGEGGRDCEDMEMVETEIAEGDGDLQTMFPVEIGDADQIRCAFNIQIIFRGFFFVSVRYYY